MSAENCFFVLGHFFLTHTRPHIFVLLCEKYAKMHQNTWKSTKNTQKWVCRAFWGPAGMGQKKHSAHNSAGKIHRGDGEQKRTRGWWDANMPRTGSRRADAKVAAGPVGVEHLAGR